MPRQPTVKSSRGRENMRNSLAVLGLALAGGCCVTKTEHGAFVRASRSYYDSVAPVYSKAVTQDSSLSVQSKKNRLGLKSVGVATSAFVGTAAVGSLVT